MDKQQAPLFSTIGLVLVIVSAVLPVVLRSSGSGRTWQDLVAVVCSFVGALLIGIAIGLQRGKAK